MKEGIDPFAPIIVEGLQSNLGLQTVSVNGVSAKVLVAGSTLAVRDAITTVMTGHVVVLTDVNSHNAVRLARRHACAQNTPLRLLRRLGASNFAAFIRNIA